MKKFFSFFLFAVAAVSFVACDPNKPEPKPDPEELPEYLDTTKESSMQVYLGPMPLFHDTTIVVTDSHEDELSGEVEMGIEGTVHGITAMRVDIVRSEAGLVDELCAGIYCNPGNGELSQTNDYRFLEGVTNHSWYTHYTPAKEGDATISYTFRNYNKNLTLKVVYRYQKSAE